MLLTEDVYESSEETSLADDGYGNQASQSRGRDQYLAFSPKKSSRLTSLPKQ